MIDANTYTSIGLSDDIKVGNATIDDLVSSRFWDMRRFIVDFGRAMNENSDIKRGDAVYLTRGFHDEGSGPWLLATIDDVNGFYTFINSAGQTLTCPSRAAFTLFFRHVLRLSR